VWNPACEIGVGTGAEDLDRSLKLLKGRCARRRVTLAVLRACPVCGVKVREDRVLSHKERVHPLTLSPEEVRQLEAQRPKHEERAPPRAEPSRGRATWETPGVDRGGVGEPVAEEVDGEESTHELPSLHEIVELLEDRYGHHSSAPGIPPELMGELEDAMDLLEDRCGEPLRGEREESEQVRFEDVCRVRWEGLTESDAALVAAREQLFDADSTRFTKLYEEGLRERKNALAAPSAILKASGERGVPHLAVALMTDSWASLIAAEALAEMPPSPLRNRALVEALFIRGDYPPEIGERAIPSIPPAERWALFQDVARQACDAGVELQSLYWTSLFEERTDLYAAERVLPELGPALEFLYDLGHHSALVSGANFLLEPFIAGGDRVKIVMRDEGVQAFLRTLEVRPPLARPKRPGSTGREGE
jgi:hypothetical protein